MKLKLYNRDEIFLVNLDSVLYFKAEDHYTSVGSVEKYWGCFFVS